MEVKIQPGKYVIAVSGGVDSMVLLDIVHRIPGVELVVAHFNHGIRLDALEDEKLVQQAAAQYGLLFVSRQAHLGLRASEMLARNTRYAFLHQVQRQVHAMAIMTAHHQDDLLETMLLNVQRGTGRKGLTSLQSHTELVRPLLHVTKEEIKQYAHEHNILWHEDSTNADESYKRNYMRRVVLPRLTNQQRQRLLDIYGRMVTVNNQLDAYLNDALPLLYNKQSIDRYQIIMLPHAIAKECMAEILRRCSVRNIDRKLIERLVISVKTAQPNTTIDVDKNIIMKISRRKVKIVQRHARNNTV